MFWNTAGLFNKDKEFWKYIGKFDFISLCETWLEKEGWERIKDKLPESHEWACSFARKVKRRGRAKGGFVIGKKKDWGKEGSRLIKEEEGDVVVSEIRGEKENCRIISVYNSGGWRELEEKLNRLLGDKEEGSIIMGGDFNIRIGELGGWEIEEMELERRSKDKVISNGGRNFVEWVQEKGWYILNGTTVGDWDGEYTYVGARGNTVIDYAIMYTREL